MKPAPNLPRGNRFARPYAVNRRARRADVGDASQGALSELSRSQTVRRTFARLSAFDVACPNCGTVDSVSAVRPWWRRKAKNFDPWRSRWRCRACRRVFAVGVVFWPVSRAGNRPRESRPADTIPSKQELLGLQSRSPSAAGVTL